MDDFNAMDSGNWGFTTETGNTEPNSAGVLDRMMSLDSAIDQLAKREADIVDYMAGTAKDMCLDFVPGDQDHLKRGSVYLLKHPDFGKDGMELTAKSVRSACKMMGTTEEFFRGFDDPQRKFVRDFNSFINHSGKGVVIRTGTSSNGISRRVESFVPTSFNRTSDASIFGALLTRLNNDFANKIRGVQFLDDNNRGMTDYRVIFGDTMLKEDPRNPTKSVVPMLSFISSEHNLVDSKIALGLYRIYCRNGMMRTDWEGGIAKWNRRNSPNKFISKVGDIIGNVGHFASAISDTLGTRLNQPLAAPAIEILYAIKSMGLIGNKHFEAAERVLEYSEKATEYDFLNLLTDSAKHLNPLTARQNAESNAMRLAMQPNGFSGIMVDGFSKDAAKANLPAKK